MGGGDAWMAWTRSSGASTWPTDAGLPTAPGDRDRRAARSRRRFRPHRARGEHFRARRGMVTLRERFMRDARAAHARGSRQRALFVVPRHNRWSLPLYEVALMFDTWLRRERVREQFDLSS